MALPVSSEGPFTTRGRLPELAHDAFSNTDINQSRYRN
jgi:hypothetical protein